ncbi:MAG: aminotransferase class I/II-fold pyridoxal phosphate-dependent enzyme [Chitinophagaceae bacterium]|jgi:dTDP-4-amino-4,6-dideoxygalactose transaminase|nr:aminotransferase class I/II-fold pyridoxal phosphate-dependent enzyme [Chitinophagaceae bacterium]
MASRIWLSSPHMGGAELKYIHEAFDTNWVAPLGPNVEGFEKDLENYLDSNMHVAALSTGTAAIHLGLILLGVKAGDEVLCQSMTFSASANPVVYCGATPVFIDSEAESWNICPEQLEIAIKDRIAKGKKPKAIIAVHLYGMPYKHKEIRAIADKYEIPILEDAAEALGSVYQEKKCGTLGDIAVLSFNGNKIITTSCGGALVTASKEIKDKAVFFATQARDKAPHYQHSEIGYNYRMSNIVAGIGRGQMEVLQSRVEARRQNYAYYREHLSHLAGISFIDEPEESFSNRWLSCILTESFEQREKIRLALQDENIESRPLWKPMHRQPVFEKCPAYTNGISEKLFETGLCLPSGSNLERKDLDRIIEIIVRL